MTLISPAADTGSSRTVGDPRWDGDGNQQRYGEIAYASEPSYSDWSWLGIYNNNVTGLNGPVYFTGAMATVNWTGGSSGAWTLGGNLWSGTDMYGNSLPMYTWNNSEAVANFNGAGSAIPVIGPVVAHGVTINSGATGYVFNGTAGGAAHGHRRRNHRPRKRHLQPSRLDRRSAELDR